MTYFIQTTQYLVSVISTAISFQLVAAFVLLNVATTVTNGEQMQQSTNRRTFLFPSQSYSKRSLNQPTFFSKLKNWIFPFGGSAEEPTPSPSYNNVRHYLPPPPRHPPQPKYLPLIREEYKTRNCNPCNSEPWIPVAKNYGKSAFIDYVPPPEISSLDIVQRPPPPPQFYDFNNQYGPPLDQHLEITELKPVEQGYDRPPINYVPQKTPHVDVAPPPLLASDLTAPQYPPLDKPDVSPNEPQQYITPPKIATASSHYPRPPPVGVHRKPNSYHQNVQPKFLPRPNGKFIAGRYKQPVPLLALNMRPPPLNGFVSNYGPPQVHLAIPNQIDAFSTNYIPPLSVQHPPHNQPPSGFEADLQNHGTRHHEVTQFLSPPPSSLEQFQHHTHSVYTEDIPPEFVEKSPNKDVQISQSVSLPVVDEVLKSYRPMPFPEVHVLPLPPLYNQRDFYNGPPFAATSQEVKPNLSTALPIESTDLTFPVNSERYNTQPNAFAGNVETAGRPETYGAQSNVENQHFNRESGREEVEDVQIIPSVPVTNFLSSVEYPINVIQSPVVDVSVSATSDEDKRDEEKRLDENKVGDSTRYDVPSSPGKLNENPIIVDTNIGDSRPSETVHNVTYHERKRDNEVDLGTHGDIRQNVVPDLSAINNLLAGNTAVSETVYATQPVNKDAKITPSVDYSSWVPTYNTLSTSMVPPPPGDTLWLSSTNDVDREIFTTTETSKRIQIIIPYTTNNRSPLISTLTRKPDLITHTKTTSVEPKLSLFTLPPTSESVWLQHVEDYNAEESKEVTAQLHTEKPRTIINIKDLLKENYSTSGLYQNLPFDVISLQKNIDGWTEQEYSHKVNRDLKEYSKSSTVSLLAPSKKIPDNYFITKSYVAANAATTSKYFKDFYDHVPAGSSNEESKLEKSNELDSNFVTTPTTTAEVTAAESETQKRFETSETLAPRKNDSGAENIYIVTPEPLKMTTESTVAFSSPPKVDRAAKGAARPSPIFAVALNNPNDNVNTVWSDNLKVVFSEWPHLSKFV